ncbi:MAG: hypothetical protein WBA12_06055 [Catalinimonas sp.]
MRYQLPLLLSLLLAAPVLRAQELIRSEQERKKSRNLDMFVLGGDASGFYVGFAEDYYYQGTKNKTVVARYGPDLAKEEARVLETADRKDNIFYTFYFGGQIHTLVATDGSPEVGNVQLQSYDKDLEKDDARPLTMLLPGLFSFSPANYMRAYFSSQYGQMRFSKLVSHRVSPDGKRLLLLFNYQYLGLGQGGYHAVLLDENLEKTWEQTLLLPDEAQFNLLEDATLDDAGRVYLLVEQFSNDKFRKTPTGFDYRLYRYQEGNETLQMMPFDAAGRFVTNLGLTLSANQEPLLGGIHADPVSMEPAGAVGIRFAGGKGTVVTSDFDGATAADLRSKRDARSNAPEYTIKHLFAEPDGGVTFFAESYYRGPVLTASINILTGVNPDVEIGDIYAKTAAVRLGPDLKPRWTQVIEKRQQSTEDRDLYSSFVVLRDAEGYHVLWNDRIRSSTDVEAAHITPDGKMRTETLLDSSDDHLRLVPPLAAHVPGLGLIIPTERSSSTQVLLRLVPSAP